MAVCEFTFISKVDSLPKHVIGVEQTWEELKRDFGRTGPECPAAMHFKTISAQGPQLFSVVDDSQVFYHDGGKWYRYITASDIKFGIVETSNSDIQRATSGETTNWIIIRREQ